jgi:hypothetical protein
MSQQSILTAYAPEASAAQQRDYLTHLHQTLNAPSPQPPHPQPPPPPHRRQPRPPRHHQARGESLIHRQGNTHAKRSATSVLL